MKNETNTNTKMEKNQLVDDLLKRNMEEPIILYSNGERGIMEPREDLVNKAYNRICEMWNRDEKARGFVKFLIRAFIPANDKNKIFTGDNVRDCLLGIKVAGVKEIFETWGKIKIDGLTGEERERVIRKETKNLPAEIKFATFGYYSNDQKCDKYISGETLVALSEFVKDMTYDLDDPNEVQEIMKRKMWEEKKKSQEKAEGSTKKPQAQQKAVKYHMSSMIDDETIKKLRAIK